MPTALNCTVFTLSKIQCLCFHTMCLNRLSSITARNTPCTLQKVSLCAAFGSTVNAGRKLAVVNATPDPEMENYHGDSKVSSLPFLEVTYAVTLPLPFPSLPYGWMAVRHGRNGLKSSGAVSADVTGCPIGSRLVEPPVMVGCESF
ncbi:hypothetical protein V8F20_001991 [Naviculisporaceae sp. PSN 640]